MLQQLRSDGMLKPICKALLPLHVVGQLPTRPLFFSGPFAHEFRIADGFCGVALANGHRRKKKVGTKKNDKTDDLEKKRVNLREIKVNRGPAPSRIDVGFFGGGTLAHGGFLFLSEQQKLIVHGFGFFHLCVVISGQCGQLLPDVKQVFVVWSHPFLAAVVKFAELHASRGKNWTRPALPCCTIEVMACRVLTTEHVSLFEKLRNIRGRRYELVLILKPLDLPHFEGKIDHLVKFLRE